MTLSGLIHSTVSSCLRVGYVSRQLLRAGVMEGETSVLPELTRVKQFSSALLCSVSCHLLFSFQNLLPLSPCLFSPSFWASLLKKKKNDPFAIVLVELQVREKLCEYYIHLYYHPIAFSSYQLSDLAYKTT